MNLPKIERDDDCLYLVQDISGMEIYDKSKAIVNFCDKETKLFEKEIDKAIIDIFQANGINIPNTEKSVLKQAFDMLKGKGKTIMIKDLFQCNGLYIDKERYCIVKETKNHFTVLLETDYVENHKIEILQCGVMVEETEIKKWVKC